MNFICSGFLVIQKSHTYHVVKYVQQRTDVKVCANLFSFIGILSLACLNLNLSYLKNYIPIGIYTFTYTYIFSKIFKLAFFIRCFGKCIFFEITVFKTKIKLKAFET